jgi:hypothetical protein
MSLPIQVIFIALMLIVALIIYGFCIFTFAPKLYAIFNKSPEMFLVIVVTVTTLIPESMERLVDSVFYARILGLLLVPLAIIRFLAYLARKPKPTQLNITVLVPATVGPTGSFSGPRASERINRTLERMPRYIRRAILAMPMMAVYMLAAKELIIILFVLTDLMIVFYWDRSSLMKWLDRD